LRRSIAVAAGAAGVVAALLWHMPQGLADTPVIGVGVNSDVTVDYGTSGAVETVVAYEVGQNVSENIPPPDLRVDAKCLFHVGAGAPYDGVSDSYSMVGDAYIDCAASQVPPTDISMTVRLYKGTSVVESGGNACSAADHCAASTNPYPCSSTCRGAYNTVLTSTLTWALPLRTYPSRCSLIADNQLSCTVTGHTLTIR
jgi:hypothetical protein